MLTSAAVHAARLRERCQKRELELPLLPEVAASVRVATEKSDGDARALAELIRRDAAFAGHLLRIANSPAYAPRSPIGSLQQAVSRLGLRTIGEIALVITCKTRAFQVSGHEAEVRALFQHSLATALHAREIARIRRLNVEDAFLAGLLHDVGRPTLIQALVDQGDDPDLPALTPGEFQSVVAELHEEVGGMIVSAWGLPAALEESIRHHHQARATAADGAALIAFADDLSHYGAPLRPIAEDALRSHPAAATLNLYPEDIDSLIAQRAEIASRACEILS
jgi:putative nucleotidyltransferase with HDIG domain